MLISRPAGTLALVAAGLAGVPAVGCSKESERSVAAVADTGVTDSNVPAQLPDTTAARTPDTSGAPRTPDTSATAQAVPRKPVGHPVRKPTAAKPPVRSNPAPDTSAPAQPDSGSADKSAAVSVVPAGQDKWLSYDAATNTVTFELVAGPFTFNGFRNGEATLVVPPKANIVMNFVNKDGTPHSAIVISGEGPIPNAASDPAIPRAYTNKVMEGLPQEASDVMRFPVPESGTYRIFCGVPGHGLSGMWIWMKIDPAVKAPSFGPTKA
jgi:hypothetical protein